MNQPIENTAYSPGHATRWSLWDRILGLIEQDLNERCSRKLFVEVPGEYGSGRKEIGELSTAERRSLHPTLREYVAERLLDRYLAEQGCVDLVQRRRTYTKKFEDLTPEDLPTLVEADRERDEEESERSLSEKRKPTWSGSLPQSLPGRDGGRKGGVTSSQASKERDHQGSRQEDRL